MRRRTLLSVMCLESRETPGDISTIDPVGITDTSSTTTVTTSTSDPTADAEAAAAAIITGMTDTSSSDTNDIYNVPLVP